MTQLVWDARMETGHTEIDEQHKSLFNEINKLYTAMESGMGTGDIERILLFLQSYAIHHFQTEEKLMVTHQVPDVHLHKKIHDSLLSELAELIDRYKKGTLVMSNSVVFLLHDWLLNHIQGEDQRLTELLNKLEANQ